MKSTRYKLGKEFAQGKFEGTRHKKPMRKYYEEFKTEIDKELGKSEPTKKVSKKKPKKKGKKGKR